MPTPDDPPTSPRTMRVLIAIGVAVVVIVFVVLHLTGVMGSGTH